MINSLGVCTSQTFYPIDGYLYLLSKHNKITGALVCRSGEIVDTAGVKSVHTCPTSMCNKCLSVMLRYQMIRVAARLLFEVQ